MNVENIKKVRDHIAKLPLERFDMANPRTPHGCDSAACIGGWTNLVVGGPDAYGMGSAQALLGLPDGRLFYPDYDFNTVNPFDATPAEAVAVLDHLINTGEVDWSVIDEVAS